MLQNKDTIKPLLQTVVRQERVVSIAIGESTKRQRLSPLNTNSDRKQKCWGLYTFTADTGCFVKGPGTTQRHLHRRKLLQQLYQCVPGNSESAAPQTPPTAVQLIHLGMLLCPWPTFLPLRPDSLAVLRYPHRAQQARHRHLTALLPKMWSSFGLSHLVVCSCLYAWVSSSIASGFLLLFPPLFISCQGTRVPSAKPGLVWLQQYLCIS